MARVKASSVPAVSLFPFLSILACLSGAIVVMISILSLMQTTESTTKAKAKNPLAEEMMKLQKELNKLKPTRDNLAALEEVEKKLIQLQEGVKGKVETDAMRVRLQAELENIQIVLGNLLNEQPAVQKELEALKKELLARQKKPEDMVPMLKVQGGGSGFGAGRRLFVVEATADSLIVHKNKTEQYRFATSTVGADKELNAWLASIGRQTNHQILFLVRSNGWNTYQRGAGWAENQYKLNTSKMPIPGSGLVDIAEFEKFMK
ncbi:hypothetical protein LBMAG56_11280 [Verrucomicrobiota bacterium]|nr:hypothetical protein LBMAG56_11280 [Verrucomicrobiota bacterium]